MKRKSMEKETEGDWLSKEGEVELEMKEIRRSQMPETKKEVNR